MKKSKLFEVLVRLIQESYKDSPKTQIIQNHNFTDSSGDSNEFDIVIFSETNSHPICIVIECKDHKSPIKRSYIDSFNSKCQRFPFINKKVFVSKKGYQKGAINTAALFNIDLYEFNELNSSIVQDWIDSSGLKEINYLKTIKKISVVKRGEYNIDFTPSLDWTGDNFNELFKIENFAIDYCRLRTNEIDKIANEKRDELKSQGSILNKIWLDIPVEIKQFNIHTEIEGVKYFIDQIIITVLCEFSEKQLEPISAKKFSKLNSLAPNSEVMSFLSPDKRVMYSFIRNPEKPNHTDIMVTKPDGSPIPPDEMPTMNFPEGLKVDIKYE